ncbi:MAG TPA: pilus assembly protein TadG-related protein [Candidatus Binatia bacterium]|nr:pilus assembly protein TadG-related protein [Candidatus Binatia bacterium]
MSSLNNDRGSVLVFATLMIVLLMILVGMGLDTGELVYTRSTGQAAVDAAALSAVSALPAARAANNPSLVEARATAAFLSANNYTGSLTNPITKANVSYVQYDFATNRITGYGVPLSAANGVRVALEQSAGTAIATPAFLTPLFNLFGASASGSNSVSVSAVSVSTGRPSIPIALWSQVCNGSSKVVDAQIAQQNPGNENSCWTTYLDNSSGASDIKALFQASQTCTGLPVGDIDIGIAIYENKGQAATVYDTAKNFFEAYPGRCWTIPVIVGTGNCNAKNPQPIVDWAQLCYKGIFKQGAQSYIKADITCRQDINQTTDLLCFANRLVREHAKGM